MQDPTQSPITSPNLDVNTGVVRTQKEFSDALTTDLTDEEIKRAMRVIVRIKNRWQDTFRRKFNDPSSINLDHVMKLIEEFEDEIKTSMMSLDILCTVDTTPILEGKSLVIDWIGKVPTSSNPHNFIDHDQKSWEVRKAKEKSEDFYGQKA